MRLAKTLSKWTLLTLFLFSGCVRAQNPDIRWLRSINVDRNQNLDRPFEFISQSSYPMSIAIPISVYGIGLLKQDSTIRRKGMYIAGSVAVTAGLTYAVKYTVNRQRPFETYPEIIQLTEATSSSFPSGNTSIAFSVATALSLAYPKWYVTLPSFAWASAVGYSRMHLGVHYPSDVIAGAAIGAGSAFLSHWLSKKFFETYDAKMKKSRMKKGQSN